MQYLLLLIVIREKEIDASKANRVNNTSTVNNTGIEVDKVKYYNFIVII